MYIDDFLIFVSIAVVIILIVGFMSLHSQQKRKLDNDERIIERLDILIQHLKKK